MKRHFILLLLMAVFISGFNRQTKKKIIFFGDSITELGVKPGGYVNLIDTMFQQKGLNNYEVSGSGISGNKIYDLYLRMDSDVLAKNPSAVVIFIGVNDVWHKRLLGTGTDADKFENFYNAIIKKLKAKNCSLFLCTPAVIGEKNDFTNELDGDMNKYSAIIRKVAKNNNCVLIDLRKIFLDHLEKNNPSNKDRGILTYDGVHLNAAGNKFVAEQMFNALSQNFIKE